MFDGNSANYLRYFLEVYEIEDIRIKRNFFDVLYIAIY